MIGGVTQPSVCGEVAPFAGWVSSAAFASCLHSAHFVYGSLLFGRRRVISSRTPRNEAISIKGEKQRYFTGENWETPKGIGRAFVQVITAVPPAPPLPAAKQIFITSPKMKSCVSLKDSTNMQSRMRTAFIISCYGQITGKVQFSRQTRHYQLAKCCRRP